MDTYGNIVQGHAYVKIRMEIEKKIFIHLHSSGSIHIHIYLNCNTKAHALVMFWWVVTNIKTYTTILKGQHNLLYDNILPLQSSKIFKVWHHVHIKHNVSEKSCAFHNEILNLFYAGISITAVSWPNIRTILSTTRSALQKHHSNGKILKDWNFIFKKIFFIEIHWLWLSYFNGHVAIHHPLQGTNPQQYNQNTTHSLLSTTSSSLKYRTTIKYHTTLFKVPHHPLQSTTPPSSHLYCCNQVLMRLLRKEFPSLLQTQVRSPSFVVVSSRPTPEINKRYRETIVTFSEFPGFD